MSHFPGGMESAADRAYRRKQERRARQETIKAHRASKASHMSQLSLSPCTHTALWRPYSEWSTACHFTNVETMHLA